MRTRGKAILWCLAIAVLVTGGGLSLHAAHELHEEEHSEKRGHGSRKGGHGRPDQASASADATGSSAYSAACGSCHMAYPPQLLPASAWKPIVFGDHFGTELPLDDAQKQSIYAWLGANAADFGAGRLAQKARKHISGQQAGRITEIPYLQRKHRKIGEAVFNRPGIGSFSNCKACHPGAEQGDFEDDHVRIPGQ